MGTEAVWVPLVMAAVATGASVYNTRQTERRQDNALAQQIRNQSSRQRDADAKAAELIRREAGSSDADERQTALGKFTEQIQRARGNAERPLQTVGAVSDAYKKAGSDAALGMTSTATNFADLVSRIDAPMQQRQNDALARGRYGTDIDMIRRFASGDDYLDQLRLRSIRRNPWIDAGASMLNGYAGAYGGGGGATSSSAGNTMGTVVG